MGKNLRSRFSSHNLRQRISKVYPTMFLLSPSSSSSSSSSSSIAAGMKIRSKSEENLQKLNDCMENMDDDVTKLFIEYHQTDFLKDPDLLSLLNDYFTTTKTVSGLCDSLRNCLESLERGECLLIDEALVDFADEKLRYGGSLADASFRKTITDLRNLNDGQGDRERSDRGFLASDFLGKTQICLEDLGSMISKLEKTMKQIEKKLKRVRGSRAIVTAAILAPAIALILAFKFVAGIFGSVPLEPLTNIAVWSWKKSTTSLKREKIAVTSMERGVMVALKEVEKISKLVSKLDTVEKSIRATADYAVKKRSSVVIAMDAMEKKKRTLESTIVDLDKETCRCDEFAKFGRSVARDKIIEFLSCGEISSK
ncbi:unnamed protein product [Cochlearia groenlandica]